MPSTAVTPVGVRDGDPDALVGLCDRRGSAVLAYCEVIVGQSQAAAATAEAFATFRAAVVATDDLTDLNPEALLVSAARHGAARYAATDAPHPCARVPALLAARADRSITLADHDWLAAHVPNCWTCRAPVARFEAADRAYLDPPMTPLAPDTTAAIVAAMTAAAPVRGAEPPPPDPVAPRVDDASRLHAEGQPASPNGASAHGGDVLATDYVDQPTAAWQIGVDDVDVDTEPVTEPESERPSRRAGLGRKLRERRGASTADHPAPAIDASGQPAKKHRRAGGSQLPRRRRTTSTVPAARSARRRFSPSLVLPIAFVLVAIVVALLIAGVFGGRGGASTPQSFAPGPPSQTIADPEVVSGAESATAAAIERAKARRRAANRKSSASGDDSDGSSDDSQASPDASTPPNTSTPAAEPAPDGGASSSTGPPANGDATPSGKPGGGGSQNSTPKPDNGSSNTAPKPGGGQAPSGSRPPAPAKDAGDAPQLPAPAPPAVPPG